MNKCEHCNGCLKYVWLYGRAYRYCSLCRVVYKLIPNGMERELDSEIVASIFKMVGNVI
jgi:hypothetical protein